MQIEQDLLSTPGVDACQVHAHVINKKGYALSCDFMALIVDSGLDALDNNS